MKATITTTSTGREDVDVEAIARVLIARVPGLVLERCHAGLDIDDKPFAPYSASYREALTEMGEATDVDLRLTGGLLNSVKHTSTERVSPDVVVLTFAPDTGTSPQVRPPSRGKPRAKRTGKRGPAHNLVGYWLQHGTPRMRSRPWLGLSPSDLKKLWPLIAAAKKTRPKRTG